MNKKYSLTAKCILSLIVMICLVATVSSFEFDNSLSYDKNTKTATITNAFGLGDKIADIKLTSALNEYVIRGKDVKVAEFIISNYQKGYTGAFDKIDIYDLKKANAKINDRTFTYKYYTKMGTYEVPNWVSSCKELYDETNKTNYNDCIIKQEGTTTRDAYGWVAFKELSELPEGNVKIGIFTEVKPGDYVEWIPTFFGTKISEWATWTDSLNNGLVAYWNLDETTGIDYKESVQGIANGTVAGTDYTVGAIGIHNAAFKTTKNTGFINISKATSNFNSGITNNITISLWINITSINGGDFIGGRGGNTWWIRCDNYIPDVCEFVLFDSVGIKRVDGITGITYGAWTHYVFTTNGTAISIYMNGVYQNSTSYNGIITQTTTKYANWLATDYSGVIDNATIDEIGIWNRSLSAAEIVTLNDSTFYSASSPIVTLNSPINNFYTTNTSVTFNCSAESIQPMLNLSLYINDILNWTVVNSTANEDLSLQKLLLFTEGYRNWSCKGYNNLNEYKISDTRWFNITTGYNYLINSVSYSNSSNETETKSFVMNITYNSDKYSSATSTFYYNGTAYSPIVTSLGSGNLLISKDIDIPLVSGGINKTFYWELALTNSSGTHYFNSSPYNQTVVPISFVTCNATSAALYLNFTFVDEATALNMNATIDSSSWQYYLGTGSIYKSFLFANATANPSYAFCSNTTGLNIKASVSDMHYAYPTYPVRALTELFSLTSTTVTNKVLYLLSTLTGIYSTYQVVTPGNQVIQGAHLIITRVISGSTVVVADGYTDSAGTVTFFLNPNYDHTITVTASGYNSQTLTIKPSSSTYTITMSGGGNLFVYNSSIAGITYVKYPASGLLGNGVYNFTYEVFSHNSNLQNCSMIISNTSAILFSVYNCRNSTYGYLNQEVNMSKYSYTIFGTYSVRIGGTWYVLENDARWRYMNRTLNETSTLNLRDALNQTYYLPEWGSDPAKADFSRIVFFFLFFAIILSAINFYSSYDTAYPGSFFWIMIPVVLLLTFFNGISGPGFFYLSGATNAGFFNPCTIPAPGCIGPHPEWSMLVDNWILPVHFVMLLFIYIFITARRYQG